MWFSWQWILLYLLEIFSLKSELLYNKILKLTKSDRISVRTGQDSNERLRSCIFLIKILIDNPRNFSMRIVSNNCDIVFLSKKTFSKNLTLNINEKFKWTWKRFSNVIFITINSFLFVGNCQFECCVLILQKTKFNQIRPKAVKSV